MTRIERLREFIPDPLSLTSEHIQQRASNGWKLVAIEWTREVEGDAPETRAPVEDIPYGLRVSADCQRLEIDPDENRVLMQMMELMVQDCPISRVATALNQQGYRMRTGARWSPGAVFDMLPRLIEVGPRLFSMQEWSERRRHFAREY